MSQSICGARTRATRHFITSATMASWRIGKEGNAAGRGGGTRRETAAGRRREAVATACAVRSSRCAGTRRARGAGAIPAQRTTTRQIQQRAKSVLRVSPRRRQREPGGEPYARGGRQAQKPVRCAVRDKRQARRRENQWRARRGVARQAELRKAEVAAKNLCEGVNANPEVVRRGGRKVL